MMAERLSPWQPGRRRLVWRRLVVLLSCVLCLVSCDPGGDSGTPPADPDPMDPQFIQQGVREMLDLYRTAVVQEDIDRLQGLLQQDALSQPAGLNQPRQGEGGAFSDGQTFRDSMSKAFSAIMPRYPSPSRTLFY